MTNRKLIAILISIAIVSVFFGTGCEMTVNDPIRNVPIFRPYISVQPSSYALDVAGFTVPPTLTVEVAEWDGKDGSLSFQWFTFTTLEDYFKNNAAEIDGATGASFTPNIATATAGTTYYYYVVVTNTNPDAIGDTKSASITSEIAAISFNTAGNAPMPVITQNPADASYTMGRQAAIAALEVRATVASGSLTYQWYRLPLVNGAFPPGSFTDGKPTGTPIAGATQRTYLPDLPDLGKDKNYFYVVVTNVTTDTGGTETGRTSQISIPAVITMELGEKAAPPRIDQQPKDLLYFNTDDLASLTLRLSVGAASVDGGILSYQWYSKAPSETAFTPVTADPGPTPQYQPPKEAKLYYVVVTNFNENVTGNTTESLRSKTVEVKLANTATASANAIITVDPESKQQYIRGYGGMETTWGNFFQSDPGDMEKMFNPEILGYNIWRIMIPPVTTNIDDEKTGLKQYLMARDYTNRYYENVKIVNGYNGYVLASPWSPPKEWKSNNSINSGGRLVPTYYKQYANYLRSYARHMASNGAPIYAVSIANEPNYAGGYDGCEWTPEEMRNFFKEVGRFTQGVRGFGGGKVIPSVLTVNGESANNPNINHAAMDDPVSNAAIDMFARHVYGEQRQTLWGRQNLNGRDVWMTEHNINSASETAFKNDWTWNYIWRFMNDVDLVIRLNNENAFVWWAVKRFYSFIGEGAANTPKNEILPRGWGMAHYSKFSIDTTRIDVNVTGTLGSGGGAITFNTPTANVNNNTFDLDNLSVRVTAFVSRDGSEISLVMWTPTMPNESGGYDFGTAEIRMPTGFKIRSASAMRSTAGAGGGTTGTIENMGIWEGVRIASNRQSAYVTLPKSQILSIKFIKDTD
jgi:O-glycosyl hydrolase